MFTIGLQALTRRTDSYRPGIPGGSKEGSLLPWASAFAIRRYAVLKGVQTDQVSALLLKVCKIWDDPVARPKNLCELMQGNTMVNNPYKLLEYRRKLGKLTNVRKPINASAWIWGH